MNLEGIKISKLKSVRAKFWYKEMYYIIGSSCDYEFSAFHVGVSNLSSYPYLAIVPNEKLGIGDFKMSELEFSGSSFEELANYLDSKDIFITSSSPIKDFKRFKVSTVKKALKEYPYVAKKIAKVVKSGG